MLPVSRAADHQGRREVGPAITDADQALARRMELCRLAAAWDSPCRPQERLRRVRFLPPTRCFLQERKFYTGFSRNEDHHDGLQYSVTVTHWAIHAMHLAGVVKITICTGSRWLNHRCRTLMNERSRCRCARGITSECTLIGKKGNIIW